MKIWQVQRNRFECGNLGGGFAADSSTAPAFISQQVEESTVEKMQTTPILDLQVFQITHLSSRHYVTGLDIALQKPRADTCKSQRTILGTSPASIPVSSAPCLPSSALAPTAALSPSPCPEQLRFPALCPVPCPCLAPSSGGCRAEQTSAQRLPLCSARVGCQEP